MAEKTGAAGAKPEAPDIRRKLVWRMGVAGLMIALLLGALALFDRLNAPDDEDDAAPTYTAPVPTAKQEVSQPVTTAPASSEPAASVTTPEKPAEPEGSAAPVTPATAAAAAAEAPQRPQVAAQPSLPAAARSGTPARSAPAPAGKAAASSPATAVPAAAAGANNAATRPPAASSADAAPPSLPAPLVPRLLNGYALQAGVFADTRRAEELHALLTLNGIPSTIETRVQAGPFRNRAEAVAAREKMQSLGVDSVLLPPKRSARQ
ncbi:SPOR domain-containing protein [Rhodocyclus tenuis]|uniref:Cell division protein FtsN n=1 Tax=Rhodocyclus tenuis TaxID=1066 RepID=A0A840GB61_RHOTE|nr:SPOR domain-containing protein [Rhodocyclus tenuis]MBB4245862.1 cell division protein FtsN [Rhodocyclus tenuis]